MSESIKNASSDIQHPDEYIGKRIVLTSLSELSFCGIAREVIEAGNRPGVLVETDSKSGFGVWCPLEFIKSVTVIPIPIED